MRTTTLALLLLAAVTLAFPLVGCDGEESSAPSDGAPPAATVPDVPQAGGGVMELIGQGGAAPADAAAPSLVGQWSGGDASVQMAIRFAADGTCEYTETAGGLTEKMAGTWALEGNVLTVAIGGERERYALRWIDADTLEATSGMGATVRFARGQAQPAAPAIPPAVPPVAVMPRPIGDGIDWPEVALPQPQPQPRQPQPPAGGSIPSPGGFYVYHCLDTNGIKDANGRPMEVFWTLVPEGWQFQGGVHWKLAYKDVRQTNRNDLLFPATLAFTVSAPDGRCVLASYPEVQFVDVSGSPAAQMGLYPPGSNYGGMTVWPVTSPTDYIKGFVIPRQRGLADAKVVQVKDFPALAASYDREVAILNQAIGQAGIGQVVHKAALVIVDYEQNGVTWREGFAACLMYIATPGVTMWWQRCSVSVRSPRDELEAWHPWVNTTLSNIRPNTRWLVEYLRIVDNNWRGVQKIDAIVRSIDDKIVENRAKTNAEIHRQMYPRLAPFASFLGPDNKSYFLPTNMEHQIDPTRERVRSGDKLPDVNEQWKKLDEMVE